MRFVRRASLVFSLVLMVAIAVGFVARRAELENQRDVALTTAAELGSSELSSIIDVVETTALAGTDPNEAVAALIAADEQLEACVVNADGIACTDGRAAYDDAVGLQTRWNADEVASTSTASVDVYDSEIRIEATGANVSVVARTPVEFAADDDDISLWAASDLPPGAPIDTFVVDAGVRQTVIAVTGSVQLYVVASVDDAAGLPADEYTFYAIIFGLALLLLLLAGATIIGEHRNLLERASFDPLTHLPNRGEFERRGTDLLAAAERNGSEVSVLLFDLNGFKLVNDTYGHSAGDQMLGIIADRLRRSVREDDIVARWGGDEFVVAMPGVDSEEMGVRRARQLAEAIGGRTRLEGVSDPLRVKVSVGVARWPFHGDDLESLIEAADRAMYQAKREGLVSRVAVPPSEELDLSALGMHGVREPSDPALHAAGRGVRRRSTSR